MQFPGMNKMNKKIQKNFKFRSGLFGFIPCIPFICGKKMFLVVLSVAALGLSSCAGVGQEMGLETVPDIEQRAGLMGTQDNPAVLDPFKKYTLVMAANECRFYTMKVPEGWFWKIYLTAGTRETTRQGRLKAEIIPANPPWAPLPDCVFAKDFQLKREGIQALLGLGNEKAGRPALLRFCQEGAPVRITIESQVSSNSQLMGPKKDSSKTRTE